MFAEVLFGFAGIRLYPFFATKCSKRIEKQYRIFRKKAFLNFGLATAIQQSSKR
jgi:hypothetical protein